MDEDQKIEKKNITSETMKRMNPSRNPACTFFVWCPFNDSSDTFWPQNAIKNKNVKNSANVGIGLFQCPTIFSNTPSWWIGYSGCDSKAMWSSPRTIAAAMNRGSGVASTMWNGCCSALAAVRHHLGCTNAYFFHCGIRSRRELNSSLWLDKPTYSHCTTKAFEPLPCVRIELTLSTWKDEMLTTTPTRQYTLWLLFASIEQFMRAISVDLLTHYTEGKSKMISFDGKSNRTFSLLPCYNNNFPSFLHSTLSLLVSSNIEPKHVVVLASITIAWRDLLRINFAEDYRLKLRFDSQPFNRYFTLHLLPSLAHHYSRNLHDFVRTLLRCFTSRSSIELDVSVTSRVDLRFYMQLFQVELTFLNCPDFQHDLSISTEVDCLMLAFHNHCLHS